MSSLCELQRSDTSHHGSFTHKLKLRRRPQVLRDTSISESYVLFDKIVCTDLSIGYICNLLYVVEGFPTIKNCQEISGIAHRRILQYKYTATEYNGARSPFPARGNIQIPEENRFSYRDKSSLQLHRDRNILRSRKINSTLPIPCNPQEFISVFLTVLVCTYTSPTPFT